MDISVVVPVYGVEKFIEHSLRSLFSQTKRDGVEYILVNDCTPDGSMEIARRVIAEFPDVCVKIIEHSINKGIAAVRQTGQDVAQGTYQIMIDSDDWVEPDMLEKMYNKAIETNADIVISDLYLSINKKDIYQSQNVSANGLEMIRQMFESGVFPSLCVKFVKRSLIHENSLNCAMGIDMGEDLILSSKIFCHTDKIVHLQEAFLHYRYNPTSMTKRMSKKSKEDLIAGVSEMESYFERMGFSEELKDSLNCRKIQVKYQILIRAKLSEINKASKLFPETNNLISSTIMLPFRHKIAMRLANRGFVMLPWMIYQAITIKKYLEVKNA